MPQKVDLQAIERKAFQSNFQDGLWDIVLGMLLLQMSIGPALYRLGWSPIATLAVMAIFSTLIIIGFKEIKKRVITPV